MPSADSTPTAHTSQPLSKVTPKSPATILADAEAQWLFTETELANTPSIADGMPLVQERELRTKGLNFILQVGIMLKIQQLTLYTSGVFFNRFLMRHSIQKTPENPKPLHHYQIAATALMLATKTDETIRRTKDIIIACCRVAQKNPNLAIDEQSKDYWKWRDTLLFNEDVLLESLCFDLTVESPYKILYDMLRALHVETNKPLRNSAWAFLCDSLMTTLCLLQSSRTIAAAALYCGARFSHHSLPGDRAGSGSDENSDEDMSGIKNTNGHTPAYSTQNPQGSPQTPWWELVQVRLRDVKKACNYMADLYEHAAQAKDKAAQQSTPASDTASPALSSHGMSQSQGSANGNIYVGLRSELSDDEEDGEVLDDEEREMDSMGVTPAVAIREQKTSTSNGVGESRGVKRPRGHDGAEDEEGEVDG